MSFVNSSILNNSTSQVRAIQSQSLQSFASALGVGIAVSGVQLLAFVLLKDKLPKIYQPKAFLVPPRQRSNPIPPGPWKWVMPMFKKSDDDFLRRCGLDAYFLSRYLYVLLKILFPISVVALPILLAIDGTGGNNIAANVIDYQLNVTKGLDVLTMSNVNPKHWNRLWAHCLLAIGTVAWSCYVIVQELQHFIRVRQAFLTSPQHRLRASASTVLVRGLPRKYENPDHLMELFDVYPGGLRNVWVNHDYRVLDKIVEQRSKIAAKLEAAETKLIQKCWKSHQNKLKEQAKQGSDIPQHDGATTSAQSKINPLLGDGVSANNPGQVHHNVDEAVDAIHRNDDFIDETELAKRGLLGKGIGAVGQGIQALGRGLGDGIEQIGAFGSKFARGVEDEEEGQSGRIGALGRALSRRRKPNAHQDRGLPTGEALSNEKLNTTDDVGNARLSSQDTVPRGLSQVPTNSSQPRTSNQEQEQLFDIFYDKDNNIQPRWKDFISLGDRPTMRVKKKLNFIPSFVNPTADKVDTIWYCRKELARLNRLVEKLQDPRVESRYKTMRSAFIQFNYQAAAHMACQSLAHHSPTYMTPRLVEISPDDVLWENMSVPGWAQYIRKGIGFLVCTLLLVIWTPLIAASSALSQFDVLRRSSPFDFAIDWPAWSISLIQGILPIILVNVLILLLGMALRLVVKRLGAPTRMRVELTVQKYFFTFSFIQYFLIVTVASAMSLLYSTIRQALSGTGVSVFLIPRVLATNMPTASNYFLSSILLQSLSQSAGGLLQPGTLLVFGFKLALNSTARKKFKTRTNLETMKWGTTYPLYTTLACIALIYSVISPLILPLSIIGFGIWWISTRYQMLYIYKYTSDTGGLLFPMAIKQLFTGLIVLELYLLGFFIVAITGSSSNTTPKGHLIPMVVIMGLLMVGTVLFYMALKTTFDPLLEYLPITLEDEAVERDKEFAKLLAERHRQEDENAMMKGAAEGGRKDSDDDSEKQRNLGDIEAQAADEEPAGLRPGMPPNGSWSQSRRRSAAWSSRSPSHRRFAEDDVPFAGESAADLNDGPTPETNEEKRAEKNRFGQLGGQLGAVAEDALNVLSKPLAAPIGILNPTEQIAQEQHKRLETEANEIYGGIQDDLENLTKEQRDALLSRAFKHQALRAKRPCIWMPRDELGVSDDEVRNTALFTQFIWISNEKQMLNEQGKCIYRGSPPDFDEVDLIQL